MKVTEDTNILYYSAFKNKNLIFFFRRLKLASLSNGTIQPIYFIMPSYFCYSNVAPEVTDKSVGCVVSNVIMKKVA
jgi:hypothetical protein